MNDLIEDIIALEWVEFQKVENEGGRAACQDDWTNFRMYRKNTFLTWNKQTLKSYHEDLVHAIKDKRNLLTEKYARMMQGTAPEKYQGIAGKLPLIAKEKIKLVEDISQISINWAERFAEEYPLLTANGRPIHSYEDGPYDISFETYLKGELSTYSENTLLLYFAYITQLLEENRNLSEMVMNNTVREFGFDLLRQAETTLMGRDANKGSVAYQPKSTNAHKLA